jgi:hypothetical protein
MRKHRFRWWLQAFLLLTLPVTARAQFTCATNNGTITITGYTGPGGDVTLPDSTNGYPVTSIGDWAFYFCTSLTNVTIPDSVTNIGDYAFYFCTGLTNVVIPNNLTRIADGAFHDCTSLSSVTLPESVAAIGDHAFAWCHGLSNVVIGNGVTRIGNRAFGSCSDLRSVTLPNSVSNIGDEAFAWCGNLTNVTIGNSLTNIGSHAFAGCALPSVTLPSSVTRIGDAAFYNCSSLTAITVESGNAFYSSVDGVVFNQSQTALIEYPGGAAGSYSVPNGVTSIGDHAFEGCALSSVTIPESVTGIGDHAFHYCTNLTHVTLPNGLTSIGDGVFRMCRSLTNVTLPDSLIMIGEGAFELCSSLASVTIPNSVSNIGDEAFGVCSGLSSVTIPESVTNIGQSAFNGSSLTRVTLPDSVTMIGDGVFASCGSLTNVTIPESVTSIGPYAFYYCTGLPEITVPSSLTNIGLNGFFYCTSLLSMFFEGNAPSVGYAPFGGDNNLTVYYLPGTTGWSSTLGGRPAVLWGSSFPCLTLDVGAVGVSGAAAYNDGVFTLIGAGADIQGTADAFRFVYMPAAGDCTIVARVTSVQNIHEWSKAGVMIRESLNANAANAFIALTPGNGVTWQYRSSTGGSTSYNRTTGLSAPYWVMLVRSGDTFTGYRSADGTNWTQQGSTTITMASSMLIGLAVTSHDSSSLCTATFDEVTAPGWPASDSPSAPTGLSAVALSTNQISLHWNAVASATSYSVMRSATDGGPYDLIAAGVLTTNYIDGGLAAGTAYYYVVRAMVEGSETGNSAPAAAITLWTSAPGSLVHRYTFSETAGTTVADSVGGPAWTGTLPNGGTFANGQLTLVSSLSQYVLLPAGIMSGMSDFTIEVWARLDSAGAGVRYFDFGNSTGNYMFLTPLSSQTGSVRFGILTPGGSEQDINGPSTPSAGVWNHLVVTHNGNTGILYVNGAAEGTNSAMTLNPSGMGITTNNWLGRSEFSSTYLNGAIDEFRVYNAALSPTEIAVTYLLGPSRILSTDSPPMSLSVTETHLLLSWPLEHAGFALQSCTDLTLGNWQTVASPPAQNAEDRWQVSLPYSATNLSTFYRLLK